MSNISTTLTGWSVVKKKNLIGNKVYTTFHLFGYPSCVYATRNSTVNSSYIQNVKVHANKEVAIVVTLNSTYILKGEPCVMCQDFLSQDATYEGKISDIVWDGETIAKTVRHLCDQ